MNVGSHNWRVELFAMDSDTLQLSKEGKLSSTKIWVDGALLPAPTSPGLHARNR